MILSIGHVAFDIIANMPELPRRNTSRPVNKWELCPGGGGGNFAVAVKTLGVPSSLFSVVGNDFAGSKYEKKLKHMRIMRELVHINERTTRSWMFFAGDAYQSYFSGLFDAFLGQEVPRKLVNAKIAHFTANTPTFVIQSMERLKRLNSKIKISFDPAYDIHLYDRKQLLKCLELADYFFCNEHELDDLREKTGISVQDIVDKVKVLKVTEGADGCKLYTKEKPNGLHVPTSKVAVVNAVGAGDAHAAGFLVAQHRGLDLKKSAQVANFVASSVVQGMGPQDNIPTWDKIPDRFKR